jgi:hypothetical protein
MAVLVFVSGDAAIRDDRTAKGPVARTSSAEFHSTAGSARPAWLVIPAKAGMTFLVGVNAIDRTA